MGDILSKDPPLSAKVLQIANSPFYGLSGKVTSVPCAINLLGINTVKNLALGFSIVKEFGEQKQNGLDYPLFWKRSLISAVSSKLMAQEILPELAEDAFFLGLIHDIGILLFNLCIPRQYALVIKERERSLSTFHEAEDHLIGFNHMEVGAYLFRKWSLPGSFHDAVRFHHYPERLVCEDPRIETFAKLTQISSLFADFFTTFDKSISLGMLEFYAWKYGYVGEFGIESIAQQIHKQTADIFPLFEMRIDEEESFIDLMEESRKALVNLSANFIEKLLEQQNLIEDLKKQAMHDSLTNLLNYRTFHEFLEKECYKARKYGKHLSLVLADIDDFKRVNDTCGHLAGDHVLTTLADILLNTMRKSDVVARYGGEEIAFILTDTTSEGASALSERLRKAIESLHIDYEGSRISVTISMGIASLSPGENLSRIELIKRADTALYKAKNSRKNRVCFYEG